MKDPLYWVPIKYKLTLAFVLICLLSLGVGGVVAYTTAKNALQQEIIQGLSRTVRARADTLKAHLDALKYRTEDFSSDGFIRDAVARIQANGTDSLRTELSHHLAVNKVSIVPEFFETLVVGRKGIVLASSIPEHSGRDLSAEAYIQAGEKRPAIGDFSAATSTLPARLDFSAPLTDKRTHAFLGVIVNRAAPAGLSQVLAGTSDEKRWRAIDPGLDCYLVNQAGILLSSTRSIGFNGAFMTRRVWVEANLSQLKDWQVHTGERENYAGVQVISACAPVPGKRWFVVAEVAMDEAYAPVFALRSRLLLIALALAAVTVIILFFPSRFLIRPLVELRDAVQKIEAGEQNVHVEVDSEDEIGQLAQAFNRMSNRLAERSEQIQREIVERKELEEQIGHQEKLAVIGELSAEIAHEMSTPLASIAMFAQLLYEDCPADSPFREHAEVIVRNTQTCKQVMAGLLDYGGRGSGEKIVFDINRCVEEVLWLCKPLTDRYGTESNLQLATKLPGWFGDKGRLRQVFVNLVMNAIHAMPEGGTLRIQTRVVEEAAGEVIEVEISDTGEGFSEADSEKIFKPFYTTKPHGMGTGLGLSISRKIIEACHGRLEGRSEPGTGACFTVVLPLKGK